MAACAKQDVVNIKPKSILVIGDVYGEFDFIFERIQAIHDRNGPLNYFDLALFVGDFFGENGHKNIIPYIKNQKQVPIQSYFITTDCNIECLSNNGNKICDNLYYFGQFGIKTIQDLKIAYLSGIYDSDSFNNNNNTNTNINNDKHYTTNDIENGYKLHNFDRNDIDILLTNEAPFDNIKDHKLKYHSPIIEKLITKCKPQYHFSAMNELYFQLPPFNYIENQKCEYFYKSTIIVGLSSIPLSKTFNTNKIRQKHELSNKKYIYSARMVSLNKLHPISSNLKKNKADKIQVNFNNRKYFPFVKAISDNPFDMHNMTTNNSRKRKFTAIESNDNPIAFKKYKHYCKYCNIKDNETESHLIVCEGKHSLLLLSAFNDRIHKSYTHFELIPKKHITNMLCIKQQDMQSEIHKLTECVSDYFRPNILFFYEINDGNTCHCIRNLISISPKCNDRNKLKYILLDIQQTDNIQFEYVEHDKIINSMVTQYGYIDIAIYVTPSSHSTLKANKGNILKPNMRYVHKIRPAKQDVNYQEIVNKIIKQFTEVNYNYNYNHNHKNNKQSNAVFTIEQEKEYAYKIKQLFDKFNPF